MNKAQIMTTLRATGYGPWQYESFVFETEFTDGEWASLRHDDIADLSNTQRCRVAAMVKKFTGSDIQISDKAVHIRAR